MSNKPHITKTSTLHNFRHTGRFEKATITDPYQRQSRRKQFSVYKQPQHELVTGNKGHADTAESAKLVAQLGNRPAVLGQHQRRHRRHEVPQVLYYYVVTYPCERTQRWYYVIAKRTSLIVIPNEFRAADLGLWLLLTLLKFSWKVFIVMSPCR